MSEKPDALAVKTNATSEANAGPAGRSHQVMFRELAAVHDIPLQISIEVGRMRLRVRELMRLAAGTVMELRKPAGEPFEVCVNGVPVARGEVIMVEQTSGVRIIDVFKPGAMGQ